MNRGSSLIAPGISVCMLNSGGGDHYLQALVDGLARHRWLHLAVIDFDHLAARLERHGNVKLLATGPDRRTISTRMGKIRALAMAYVRSLWAMAAVEGDLVHVQWLIHVELFDRLLVPLWCWIWRKRLIVTVHNVDPARRNRGRSGWIEQTTLRFYYGRARALIAHSANIRNDLIDQLGARPENVFLIRHGINLQVPRRGLTSAEARIQLGLPADAKVLLMFGSLAPYKGLDLLLDGFRILCQKDASYHLVVAGRLCSDGLGRGLRHRIAQEGWQQRTRLYLSYIADDRIEPLFTAADCAVLPYRAISQSGVPFLAFGFGLPVVATAVGGLEETIQPGLSGMLARPGDAAAFAHAVEASFAGGLHLPASRRRIRQWAEERFCWNTIGDQTAELYRRISRIPSQAPRRQEARAS